MICAQCRAHPILNRPPRCSEHFINEFERRVRDTIAEFRLLKKSDRVVVACSGGKDSTTVLFLLKKFGYDVTALAIDEGIRGYRARTLRDLRAFCKNHDVKLKTVSFTREFGKTLDEMMVASGHPCTLCGTLRRQLLNKHAKGFAVLATGHNADDEAQAVLMNLTRANLELFPRGGPVTTSAGKGFVRRVKPLFFCTEKEVFTYALLRGFAGPLNECPYVVSAYRVQVRDELNDYESRHPGAKIRILKRYLKIRRRLPPRQSATTPCRRCGEPSRDGLCKACRLRVVVRN
jgi:tRNA-5-methyluridine54 2-sulfurtransferase